LPVAESRGPTTDFAPGLERAFELIPEEGEYRVEEVEGEVPRWLRGTWYVNGPARFRRGGLAYRHWLDGDGYVASLRFGDDGVHFAGRFVRSHKFVAEEDAGRALFRAFGTGFPGDQLLRGVALASPVNVSVYPCAGRLLAFGEQGLPWELDPRTLETRGEHTFGGRLNAVSPFSAHPNLDPATGELFNFGISFAAERPTLTLYRFDRRGGLLYRRRQPLDLPASVHDFGLSQRHAVVYLAPYLMDVEGFLRGGATVMDSLTWQPERGSRLLVYDRESGNLRADVPIGSRYCLHHVNAFEDGAGRLLVDVLELPEPVYEDYRPLPDLFVEVAPAEPVRYELDLERQAVVGRRALPLAWAADFPAVDAHLTGRPYRHFWLLAVSATGRPGRKFLDRLVHLDWDGGPPDVWAAPPGSYLAGEPVFVPEAGRPGGNGLVLAPLLDAGALSTALLVFDALAVARGPVARLRLGWPLHLAFHACFHPG
jgi:all-trans-8'-apo-beta-carotenal 15,15'-oxygenase